MTFTFKFPKFPKSTCDECKSCVDVLRRMSVLEKRLAELEKKRGKK